MKKLKWAVFAMFLCAISMVFTDKNVYADVTISGSNSNSQNYGTWSKVVKSYLSEEKNQIIRFQANAVKGKYMIEYYDKSYNLKNTVLVDEELPLFGAFYSDENNYYVISGQKNKEESNDTEVYRITKYDKNWNRIKSTGLFGANTTVPFDAGSCRVTECDKYLIIRTSHEMYTTSDGYNHQANVTIEVEKENMEVTDSYTGIMNTSYGYVSHSFNQFINIDDNKIVAVDHGDAYPRSIALILYDTDVSTGKFRTSRCKWINIMKFSGEIGNNSTGASVGGFEISDSSYIVAGNSVDRVDSDNKNLRDIFIGTVDKSDKNVNITWLTDAASAGENYYTPQLVKVNGDRFIVLWSNKKVVNYCELNGKGQVISPVYSMEGNLSDCKPVVIDNNLVWYVYKNDDITFYQISLSDISQNGLKTLNKQDVVAEKNGIILDDDNQWRYYVDGVFMFNYTGLASNENGWWYIENGCVNFNYTGLVSNENGWWKITNGAVDFVYTGLAYDQNVGWWYVENGAINFNATGVAQNEYGWWAVVNGTVDFNYTGLLSNEYGWWYLENGCVNFGYTGIKPNENGWWKVTNGAVDFSYTGLASNENGWFYLENGCVNFDYTGKASNENGTWNVVNGQVVF